MSSVNKAIIVGNLGRDPETKTMNNGDKVCNLSIATSERWKDKNTGEQQERTEWHRVVLFRRLAEIAEQYLRKGSKVYLEGKIKTRKWTDNNNNDRYTTEIVLDGFNSVMVMLDSRQSDGGGDYQAPATSGAPAQQQQRPAAGADFDDEIPF